MLRQVVPNRGAVYNTQGCRELIRFSVYHRKGIFKMSLNLKPNFCGFATRCRRLCFSFVGCRKPEKVGKHWLRHSTTLCSLSLILHLCLLCEAPVFLSMIQQFEKFQVWFFDPLLPRNLQYFQMQCHSLIVLKTNGNRIYSFLSLSNSIIMLICMPWYFVTYKQHTVRIFQQLKERQ